MYIAYFVYSLSGIFLKLAAGYELFSVPWILYFGVIILILGVYAILWQQVLKEVPLSIAMGNKPIVLILGSIWAIFFFKESVGINFFVGMGLIIIGLCVIG